MPPPRVSVDDVDDSAAVIGMCALPFPGEGRRAHLLLTLAEKEGIISAPHEALESELNSYLWSTSPLASDDC